MSRVQLDGVGKAFPGHGKALADVSLDIAEGDLFVLLGRSGSGKTSLLRLIAGLDQPDQGTIRLGGREVTALAPRHRDVAMVFQRDALDPTLTVRQNLAFSLQVRQRSQAGLLGPSGLAARFWPQGMKAVRRLGSRGPLDPNVPAAEPPRLSAAAIEARVMEVAATLGLTRFLDRWPRQLSGGERQRVALGRALVRRPAVLLLDEPMASLDPPLRRELRQSLVRIHRDTGQTMILVTHDQAEALALGTDAAILEHGRVLQMGPIRTLYDRPDHRTVAEFLGMPGMNLARVWQAARWAGVSSSSVEPMASICQAGSASDWIGVRAEHLRLTSVTSSNAADGKTIALPGVVVDVEDQGDSVLVTVASGPLPAPEREESANQSAHLDFLPGSPGISNPRLRWTVRVPTWPAWVIGEPAVIRWDGRQAHRFDGESGSRIDPQ